jgi:catechol 2,3-dioxygenase-like lactoylglutathione lyase family enzyme
MRRAEAVRFELFCRDPKAAATFLVNALGFRSVRDGGGYHELRLGEVTIGLGQIESLPDGHPLKASAAERLGLGIEIVIETDDVDAAYERARSAGDPPLTELGARPWGLRDFRVTSPDGYYFRITSR